MDYPGDVTVKVDGIAASAASVIAMAGTRVLMSPVSTMMTVSYTHLNPDSRPEIANKVPDFEEYDTVFLGFPIWWYCLLYTSLFHIRFSEGKYG